MSSPIFPDLIPVIPEILIAIFSMFLLILGVFLREKLAEPLIRYGSLITIFVAFIILIVLPEGEALTFGNSFINNEFCIYMKALVLISSAASILMAREFLHMHQMDRFEFYILILFAVLGMFMMISANDFIALYLGLELQSLSLYVLASFQRESTRSAEAGLKYFILGALASGLFLYGVTLIYGFTGNINFNFLYSFFGDPEFTVPIGVIVGLVLIIGALAFKISAAPFHMWAPDVYQGAPTPVTAFFSVAPKIAAIALIIRVMIVPFGNLGEQWQQIIIFISIASMVLGAFAAINQTNIKRLMAYSSIGHIGYALMGLAVAAGPITSYAKDGIQAMLVYITIYLFMSLGTFACILCMKRGDRMVEEISGLSGLSKNNPVMAGVLTVLMFSMAGIPPLAGFFGKLYIFQAAIQSGLVGLAVIGVLTSVVGAFYYLRIVKVIYFDDAEEKFDRPIAPELRGVLLVSGLFIVLFIFIPTPIISLAEVAALALFPG